MPMTGEGAIAALRVVSLFQNAGLMPSSYIS